MSAKTTRLLSLYAEDLPVRFGERTAATYLAHVRALISWLKEKRIELVSVRTDDLLAYQNHLLSLRKKDGTPYSASLQQNRLSGLKSLFRFLYRRLLILHDPSASLEYPRIERRLPRAILTKQEASRILEAPETKTPRGLRARAILETLYATGIRVSELANLELHDVDTEERTLRVVMGKGRKDRTLPLTHAAAEAIDAYLARARGKLLRRGQAARFLFLSDHGGWMHRWVLGRIVHRAAERAGVKKRVTCHTFRHSVATHLLRGRADIRHIQALLGHASLSTTERYTRVEIQDLREVIARAHPRGR